MDWIVDQLEASGAVGSSRESHELVGHIRAERVSRERRPAERVAAGRATRAGSEVVVEGDATLGEALRARVAPRASHAEKVLGAGRVFSAELVVAARRVMARARGVVGSGRVGVLARVMVRGVRGELFGEGVAAGRVWGGAVGVYAWRSAVPGAAATFTWGESEGKEIKLS